MSGALVAKLCAFTVVFGACVIGQVQSAEYHSSSELKQRFRDLAQQAKEKNAGSAGRDLGSYGNHALKLSYRRGTGQAEVHVHAADVMVVTAGSATILTGGSLVHATEENGNEIKGSSIDGGTRQVLSVGDIIHIPAGMPHQLILDRGKDFSAFVLKIHE